MSNAPKEKSTTSGAGINRMGGGYVEKPKNFKETMRKLISYCKDYRIVMLIALIAAMSGMIFQIIGPDKLKDMTDEIVKGLPQMINGAPVLGSIDMDAVQKIAWMLLFFYAGSFLLNFVQSMTFATVTQKISQKLRKDISQKITLLPLRYFDKTSYGDVLSRVTNDVDTIGQTLNQSLGTLVTSLTLLIGSTFMMFYTNWLLALTAIVSSLLGFFIIIVIMKKSQGYFKDQQKELGLINGHVEEVYTGHTVVKVYNASKDTRATFEDINDQLYVSAWKSQFLSGLMMPVMIFIGNFGYVSVCIVGALLAMNGSISFGVIVAFTLYIRLFSQPFAQLAQAFNNLQRTAAASERVFEFLNEPELENEKHKQAKLKNVKGNVEFKNVKFGYKAKKPVINNFSARIEAGQKVAIVGPTGAGKTTIVNLLMRFYELDSGDITIDGVSLSDVPRTNVHDQFSMVLQDTWIFADTIKQNIIYNKENITDAEIVSACKASGLHHFIKTLPNKYDTILNDKSSLSEGQKQLVTIARAMIKNAPLLILDEATSSIDTRTERIVQREMDRLMEGKTSFVIAHRLSTIKNADLILVMDKGDIIESGTHSDLLKQDGFYASLYNSQFEPTA